MTAHLRTRLRATIQEKLDLAKAASQARDSSTPTGEHWQWECGQCDTPLPITPVTILDEFVKCPRSRCDRLSEVALRSVEEYPTRSVGPLPHFVINCAQELRPVDAAFIAAHDPAAMIRQHEAALRVLERHAHKPPNAYCAGDIYVGQPCDELSGLADAYGVPVDTEGHRDG